MNRNLIVTLAIVAIVASSFALGAFLSLREKPLAGIGEVGASLIATSGVMYISPADSRVLGTSSARSFAIFSNNSSNAVYLSFNNDKPIPFSSIDSDADDESGILIAASSTYRIDQNNLYTGSVRAFTTSRASSSLLIIEGTYR